MARCSSFSATHEWNHRIGLAMGTGLDKAAAIKAVALADPELQAAYCAEADPDHIEKLWHEKQVARAVAAGDAEQKWQAALDARMARGASKTEATRALVKAEPVLHAAYLRAYTARVNARVRK